MIYLTLHRDTYAALRERAMLPFRDTSRPCRGAPDYREIPFKPETLRRLFKQMFGGESFDDAILRLTREGPLN